MANSSRYATTFAESPRFNGVASVSNSPAGVFETRVVFATKESITAGLSALAAADAEREPITVKYESEAGTDVRVVTVAIGPAAKVSAAGLRKAASSVIAKLRSLKVTEVDVVLPKAEGVATAAAADAIVQGTLLANYVFDRYLTTADKIPSLLSKVHFVSDDAAAAPAIAAATAFAEGTILARDLCNERADEMNPSKLESVARTIAAETGAEVFVLKGEELRDQGLHLLYSVGQAAGAANPEFAPRYIELNYKGDPSNPADVIMLVGKGITFDSGGLNIKGTGFMEDMHMDMGGSAAVLGSLLAAHRLGVKRNIVAIATVAENAIDAAAYKPKNIIRSHKGLTVEIGNTDAEGRLALADALSLGQARNRPHTVIDLATLTGACIIALGEYAAGLFGNNTALKTALTAAGESRGERLWSMPIFPEHREELKGAAQADLQSTGAGRYGGACTAAAFLENFIGLEAPAKAAEAPAAAGGGGEAEATKAPSVAWAHIDIAGPAMRSKPQAPHYVSAGTGFGVQAVAQYLLTAPKGGFAAEESKA